MEKSTAIQILELLSRNISEDKIEIDNGPWHKEIKREHLQALAIAIDNLKEETK